MKVNDYIKNKAFLKLKEINSSKGETNAKAQQYLDGLLKIPFGNYKKESILTFLEDYIEELTSYCNFIIKNDFKNLKMDILEKSNELVKEVNLTSKYLENFITILIEEVKKMIMVQPTIHKILLSFKNKQLKNILQSIQKSKVGKKINLIEKIKTHFFELLMKIQYLQF